MMRLAWTSLAARRTAFTACALSLFLGSALILSFLSLLETGLAAGVSDADRETLVTMASVVGGWGVVIVVFSVASTLGLAVRARAEEFALLRTIGGTRRQLQRMVRRETLAVAALASLAGLLPGWLLGRVVLALVRRAEVVGPGVQHRIGPASICATVLLLMIAAGLGATLAARRATRGAATEALTRSLTGSGRMGRGRIALGVICLVAGLNYSILTVTVMAHQDDPYTSMSTAGPASVFWSLGLAILAAPLLRWSAGLAGVLLSRSRVSGHLALYSARRRSTQLAGALTPVIIFVGIATGTLYLMSITNATVPATPEGQTLRLLNGVVIGMISLFAAIMVVNTLVATVSDRRREFATQRLAGMSIGQVTAMAGYEGALIAVTGIVLGGLASLGTVIPYAIIKTDGWLPDAGPGLFLGICAVAAAGTIGTSLLVARRTATVPALAAAA